MGEVELTCEMQMNLTCNKGRATWEQDCTHGTPGAPDPLRLGTPDEQPIFDVSVCIPLGGRGRLWGR